MHLMSLAAAATAAFALVACASGGAPAAHPLRVSLSPSEPTVGQLVDSLSVREKIAQLVMPWAPGNYTSTDDETARRTVAMWIDSLHVGGLLVSVGSPLDIAAKLNDLQRRSPLPLLVASDLESGTSIRFLGGTPFPPNMGVGATGRELDAYEIGRVTALEGRAVGVHLTFAPVADVNNNPANPIINTRSFGERPKAVAELVAAAVRGIQDHGMLATAKHFPGHGDTETDTHLSLPSIAAGWARFDSLELVPFRAAIAAGVSVVMSAHIALPSLDVGPARPGTLAPNILTGLLRDSLGFKGISVTDALNMGSLLQQYAGGEAAVLAFLAGADLLLQPADPQVVIEAMEEAVRSGRISDERLDRSVRRLLEAKERLGLFRERLVPLDSVTAVVGRAEFQALASDIAARSIVLVEDRFGVVDSLRRSPQKVTLVTYGDDRSPAVGNALAAELRAHAHRVTLFRLWPNSGGPSYDSAQAALAESPVAIFAAAVRPSPANPAGITVPASLAALIDATALARATVLISLGSPYLIRQTSRVGSYLLGWASNSASELAVARALSGAPITGTLPARVPPNFPVGTGLQRPAPDQAAR